MNELIRIDNDMLTLDAETEQTLVDLENCIKYLQDRQTKIKEMIMAEMEEKKIIKVDTEKMTISYIQPTDRETFDSKRFRTDHADLYDEYIKMLPVKASVRVKIK